VRTPSCAGVAPGRERLAVAAPHDRAHVAAALELREHFEQARVHRVVRGVVLLGPVVADDSDRTLELERDELLRHGVA